MQLDEKDDEQSLTDIAVIGLSCQFPGADNVETFWNNLVSGVESIQHFSKEELEADGISKNITENSNYVKSKGILNNIDKFDASFFGFNPKDATITDPQHKLFLEQVWQALENAGYVPEKTEDVIGIYGSMADSSYAIHNLYQNKAFLQTTDWFQTRLATSMMSLTTQVSYRLNLTGPSININTACSSGLVAIATACQGLIDYTCDIAIAGAVAISVPQKAGYFYHEGGIQSPDGHCRPFDEGANGTVFSDGLGVVVLKRLNDAIRDHDSIQAVIKGWHINNDGKDKAGYTAPSVNGQVNCITAGLAFANISADSLGYIEGHGTGTSLGDAIELKALAKVFKSQTNKKQFCALGSVKGNIGHSDIAAGMASFIKTILALKHKKIPPTLHYHKPNSKIDLEGSFYVNSVLEDWNSNDSPRRAGVNALGIGGTNAFLVVEEFEHKIQAHKDKGRDHHLLLLSAKSVCALEKQTQNCIGSLERINSKSEFADAIFTLQIGRSDFNYRKAVICKNKEEAIAKLKNFSQQDVYTQFYNENHQKQVVFMFTGQGSQYPEMGKHLYHSEPEYAKLLKNNLSYVGVPLRDQVMAYLLEKNLEKNDSNTENNPMVLQVALFILEYTLAQFWMYCGVKPHALIGHSLGEYVAATLSGVFTVKDALLAVCNRAKLMSKTAPGAMLAVFQSAEDLAPLLAEVKTSVSIALHNSPNNCVISGSPLDIESLQHIFEEQNITTRKLNVTHAFHSSLMDPILDDFNKSLEQIKFNPPQIPIISNLTGTWVKNDEIIKPGYWVSHLRETVRFTEGLQSLSAQHYNLFLEIGPGKTLTSFAKEIVKKNSNCCVLHSLSVVSDPAPDQAHFLKAMAHLWLFGVEIKWSHFYKHENRYRVPLPSYPFDRKTYWISGDSTKENLDISKLPFYEHANYITTHSESSDNGIQSRCSSFNGQNAIERGLFEIWQKVLGVEKVSLNDDFYELGGHSLAKLRMLSLIEKMFNVKINFELFHDLKTANEYVSVLTEILSNQEVKENSLITIRSAGVKPPLFCFHPIDGTIFCYAPLGKLLSYNCPIFALQDPSIKADATLLFNSIEDMARHYIKQIQTVQPRGPYTFCGYSFGGILAIEAASQLRKEGEKVNPIILFDSWAKLPEMYYNEASFKSALISQLPYLKSEEALLELCWRRMNLLAFYKLPDIADKLILFKAQEMSIGESWSNNDSNYWNEFAKGGINHHIVQGNHETLLQESHIQHLTNILNTILETFNKEFEMNYE